MEFKFPIPPGYTEEPLWIKDCFRIGSKKYSILKYTKCDAGWDSNLTDFHEKEAEDGSHYIDRASRFHACTELKKIMNSANSVILEVGSSSGYLLREIKTSFPASFLIGSDCIPEPLEKIAQKKLDIPLIQFDLANCPLPDNCVDIVIALNVLEHIEDDIGALQHLYRILKPGGYAIIEVPANQELYDFYDEQLKHFRRYALCDLKKLTYYAGFTVCSASHLGFFIYPGFKYIKHRNKQNKLGTDSQKQMCMKNQIQLGGQIINNLFYLLMRIELALGKYIQYPIGIRCLFLLRKKIE